MDLLERKREEHRSRALQRVGSVLVCISFLLALVFPPQQVKAVVVADDLAVAALAAAFLSSCGMTFSASGMDTNGVKEQIGSVLDGYLNEMFDGQSPLQWLGEFTLGYGQGKIVLPAGVANKLAGLAEWVQEKFNVKTSFDTIIYNHSLSSIKLQDGSNFYLMTGILHDDGYYHPDFIGTIVVPEKNLYIKFANGAFIFFPELNRWEICYADGSVFQSGGGNSTKKCLALIDTGEIIFTNYYSDNTFSTKGVAVNVILTEMDMSEQSFQISCSDLLEIPDTIPDTQEVAISTGAASDLTLDQALEQILAAIAEGQLSATREIVDAGTATDDPAQTITDVDELGLPALAETLTTRFPFSIPWDVAKAVKLLAAPPKTPRFEVDFMAPIAYRFGGQLGNTNIVLDFSDYEIIGQISRWTSTIGFCLFLASGTKKLIWTA